MEVSTSQEESSNGVICGDSVPVFQTDIVSREEQAKDYGDFTV